MSAPPSAHPSPPLVAVPAGQAGAGASSSLTAGGVVDATMDAVKSGLAAGVSVVRDVATKLGFDQLASGYHPPDPTPQPQYAYAPPPTYTGAPPGAQPDGTATGYPAYGYPGQYPPQYPGQYQQQYGAGYAAPPAQGHPVGPPPAAAYAAPTGGPPGVAPAAAAPDFDSMSIHELKQYLTAR